ncbi:hypothetical protein ACJMK2_024928 [Sinanodonta woodiana]|uniref:Uncharacterized protein n=1 Tax=Sinanodonta woodiana TaxID=1069815 RepID=A0ABD3XII6_SINWO
METIAGICIWLLAFELRHTTESGLDTFVTGENVIIRMDELQINATEMLQIHFHGFISKQHISNVLLYNPLNKQPDQISFNRNYTGRIERFNISNSSLSFLLLNIKYMDSGTYTVLTVETSVVKVETSILVARQTIRGQYGDSMNITFICNTTNISLIKIEMIEPKLRYTVLMYNVTHAKCTEVGQLFTSQIESCVFNGITFSFTIRRITWLEIGTYVAWDDQKFLLDSIFVSIDDYMTRSSTDTTGSNVTVPSTVKGSTDESKLAKGNGKQRK